MTPMEDNEPHKPFYDFIEPEKELKSLQSSSSRKSDEQPRKKVVEPIDTSSVITMRNRYKKAQEVLISRLPMWRQKEIDIQLKSGKLSDKHWDEDFIKQVIELAESDIPLH